MGIEFEHDPKLAVPEVVVEAFKRGVTKWVETTGHGFMLWDYNLCELSSDLCIGDILGLNEDAELLSCLAPEGISSWKEASAENAED